MLLSLFLFSPSLSPLVFWKAVGKPSSLVIPEEPGLNSLSLLHHWSDPCMGSFLASFKFVLISNIFTKLPLPVLFFKFIHLYLREKEREHIPAHAQGGEERRQRERESEAGSVRTVSTGSDVGLKPTNCGIRTWAEAICLTDWATQALPCSFCSKFLLLAAFHPTKI